MFVVELSEVDGFHGLVRALNAVVQEGDFTATDDGLGLRDMDPSRVAMVDFLSSSRALRCVQLP